MAMMSVRLFPAAILAILSLPGIRLTPVQQDPWAAADRAVRRLHPSAFPQLPSLIRRSLEQRRCLVPQSRVAAGAHNVIEGRLRRQGTKDWAVLCSRGGASTILVFWGGDPSMVDSLATAADRTYLQGMGAEGIVFSRYLSIADPTFIRAHAGRSNDPLPAGPIHEGINDAFAGKGSVVWYRDGQRWHELAGAD
jgi:hypothetical protein